MCDHRILDDPNGLKCYRVDRHVTGHTYESTSAGDAEPASGDQE